MTASILLVEDDPNISRLLEIYLGRSYQVRRVSTAEEASAALDDHTFDYVLLDVTLPDRSGWEVMPAVQQSNPAAKILIMTGHSDPDTESRAHNMGAATVLHKPLTPAQVKAAIEALD